MHLRCKIINNPNKTLRVDYKQLNHIRLLSSIINLLQNVKLTFTTEFSYQSTYWHFYQTSQLPDEPLDTIISKPSYPTRHSHVLHSVTRKILIIPPRSGKRRVHQLDRPTVRKYINGARFVEVHSLNRQLVIIVRTVVGISGPGPLSPLSLSPGRRSPRRAACRVS